MALGAGSGGAKPREQGRGLGVGERVERERAIEPLELTVAGRRRVGRRRDVGLGERTVGEREGEAAGAGARVAGVEVLTMRAEGLLDRATGASAEAREVAGACLEDPPDRFIGPTEDVAKDEGAARGLGDR